MNQTSRWLLFALGLTGFAAAITATVRDAMPPPEVRVVEDYVPWEKETLDTAELLPVQDGGRIKPLSTYASFTMLRLYGARSMKITAEEGGEEIRIKPLAWMMDALFRPNLSMKTPSFRVEDSDVLRAVGVTPRARRDRYSYDELEPGRQRLHELAQGYSRIDSKLRKPMEKQVIALEQNMQTYEQLVGTFGPSRAGLSLAPVSGVSETARRADVSAVMATAPMIRQVLERSREDGREAPPHVMNLLTELLEGANSSAKGLFVFPPADKDSEDWLSPGLRVMNVMSQKTRDVEGSIADIAAIESLTRKLSDGETDFRGELATFRDGIVERAEARGEYRWVPLEADYYRKNWFLFALVWFLFGTVLAIGMWMTGNSLAGRILAWGVGLTTFAGWVYVVIPIVKRCIIMQRPPVGNLYDTIIFITAAVVLFGAVIEWFTKRRFALGLLPIAGAVLILFARLFEVGDARDHMDPLVAVLRSNFWLTTHVICITLGYAGGLVMAFLGIIYVLLRGLKLDGGDASVRRSLTRAVYGMLCVTLILSLVGTVLGGIWANDSWGRFWGWDPKENGALMIVLANLAMLHARMGGYIREWGMHLSAIFTGAIVTFSWWHVNALNTGLHSYGFADGKSYIWAVYGLVGIMILFGMVARALELASKMAEKRDGLGQRREQRI